MKASGRRVITRSPENSETPIDAMRSWVTPNEQFYVRNHFDDPVLDQSSWTLCVSGWVEQEGQLAWEDLARLPQASLFATLECAGNGRSFLEGEVAGVQWGAGAVGNARWSGVRARSLLDLAGVKDGALEVVFEGSDNGVEGEAGGEVRFARSLPLDLALHPDTLIALRMNKDGALEVVFEGSDNGVEGEAGGEVRFARSLPLDLALHPDTLIALRMNGEVLAREHGYPARLVVPGWYGVASVKWLSAIRVVTEPFRGFFQSIHYTVRRKTARGLTEDVVGMMLPKSEITWPRQGERLKLGSRLIEGLAWAGPEAVAAVELSCDGGESWKRAELVGSPQRYTWIHWRVEWAPPRPGVYRLFARAISRSGEIQPSRHNPLHGGYHINFSRPLEISVEDAGGAKPLVFAI